ncbi:PH domain-containing protein [Nocardioides caeni]|uniref:PH domain-containing protein n=1 Tax=Nocardioides caeni TaxID=574700 RepID=UPI00130513FE|nr:PH domain-containing protein [Nocardioides caeni]
MTLPRTWRPLGPRIAAPAFALILVAAFAALWLRFDESTKDSVNVLQKLTIFAIVGLAMALLFAMARSRVEATTEGLVVVNGYRRRTIEWAEVGTVRVPQGAPWPHLDLGDDERVSLMGIHTSDGRRAEIAVRELRAVVADHRVD